MSGLPHLLSPWWNRIKFLCQINGHSMQDWPLYSDFMVTFPTLRNALCCISKSFTIEVLSEVESRYFSAWYCLRKLVAWSHVPRIGRLVLCFGFSLVPQHVAHLTKSPNLYGFDIQCRPLYCSAVLSTKTWTYKWALSDWTIIRVTDS